MVINFSGSKLSYKNKLLVLKEIAGQRHQVTNYHYIFIVISVGVGDGMLMGSWRRVMAEGESRLSGRGSAVGCWR